MTTTDSRSDWDRDATTFPPQEEQDAEQISDAQWDDDGWPDLDDVGDGPLSPTAPAVTGLSRDSEPETYEQWSGENDDSLGFFGDKPAEASPRSPQRALRGAPRRPARRPDRAETDGGLGRGKKLIAGGALAILLLGGGGLAAAQLTGDDAATDEASQEAKSETQLSRTTPPGWSQDLAWVTAADPQSNIAVGDDRIAFLNGSGVLVVLDALTGETVYSSTPTGANPGSSTVALTSAGGDPVVVVVQDDSITAWSLGDDPGESKRNGIPSSATVSTGGGGALVITDDQTWTLNSDLGLSEVKNIPADVTPMAVTPSGAVVAGSTEGGWSLIKDNKPKAVKADMAESATGSVMYPAWSSKGIVVAWAPTDTDEERAVGLYDAESGELLANTVMSTDQVNLGLPLTVSPDHKLAAVGTWLVDLERGESETVDGWSTSIAIDGAIYGAVGDQKHVWNGAGEAQDVAADAAIPWGTSSAGDGIVLSDEGGDATISGVRPE